MSVNQSLKKEVNDSVPGWQPYLFWFAIVIAVALIILPVLPGLMSNLVYSFQSFEGKSPKIYWYLSRSAGFVAFAMLWFSMVLGLGISNKMTRRWPGAAAAFALHEYVSLLGVAFSAYHGLVLIGDHFVDFSLPRLLTPFSIEHATLWVGLGQVSFYVWCVAALSFYIRKWIGQKTWRFLHYINFATFIMALLHGLNSGSDSHLSWARGIYSAAGLSLLMLLVYRIYDSGLKDNLPALMQNLSFSRFTKRRVEQAADANSGVPTRPSVSMRIRNLPQSLLRAQSKKTAPAPTSENEQPANSLSVQSSDNATVQVSAAEDVKQPSPSETIEQPAQDKGEIPSPEVQQSSNALLAKPDEPSPRRKIRIRIFDEPVTPEAPPQTDPQPPSQKTLLIRLRDRFRRIPVEPIVSADRESEPVDISND